jgi:hypothetical protein
MFLSSKKGGIVEWGNQTRLAHSLALFAAVVVPSLVYSIVLLHGYDCRPYLRGDCAYYYVTALSIAQDRDLDLFNQLPGNVEDHATQVSLAVDGRIVPKHPIVMPLVSLPFVALLGPPGALGFNVIQLTALLVIIYCLAARWASTWIAAGSVILTGIGSVMPHYVWNYSPDIFATVLLTGALVALPASSDEISPSRHLLAGLLLGLSWVSKFPPRPISPSCDCLLHSSVHEICSLVAPWSGTSSRALGCAERAPFWVAPRHIL